MRIKVSLVPLDDPAFLPLDNYPLTSLIYRTVELADKDYAAELHGRRSFKFFTYSKPYLPDTLINKGRDDRVWFRGGRVTWQIGSPDTGLIAAFVNGLILRPVIGISDAKGAARFVVERIEHVGPPEFAPLMRFTTLSPITVAVEDKTYLWFDDPRFGEQVGRNLCHKFRELTGTDPGVENLRFEFDREYLAKHTDVRRISRMEHFKGTSIRAWRIPFIAGGDPALISLGWECGFGESNSKGFGMAQAVSGRSDVEVIWVNGA